MNNLKTFVRNNKTYIIISIIPLTVLIIALIVTLNRHSMPAKQTKVEKGLTQEQINVILNSRDTSTKSQALTATETVKIMESKDTTTKSQGLTDEQIQLLLNSKDNN